jgi:GNAT superfamily N-acetyltransferase
MTAEAAHSPSDRIRFRDVTTDDFAWVRDVHREIYLDQLGWPPSFMGTVDDLLGALSPRLLAAQHNPQRRERGWIATIDGEPVGAIIVVQHDEEQTTAKLRMLVVSGAARGHGIGSGLLDRVIAFARDCGYTRIDLWTESTLKSARRLYTTAGFRIVEEAPSEIIPGATAETWRLDLQLTR